MAKNRSSKGRRSAQKRVDESNAINAGSKAFSPASLRGISAQAGKHKISLLNADGSKKRINYSKQTIKCAPDVKSGLRLSDLLIDKTGRIEKSKASLRLMQAHIGANIDNMTRLVESARNCAALVDTGETIDNIAIYKPNASLQAIYNESKRADVRGIKFDNDAAKVLLVKRTKKGTSRILAPRSIRLDTIADVCLKWSRSGIYKFDEFAASGASINFVEIDKRDAILQERSQRDWQKRFDNRHKGSLSRSLQAIDNQHKYCAALVELAFESLD